MAKKAPPKELTTGEIAKRIKKPRHSVWRAIKRLGIKPVRTAGSAELYSSDDVRKIRDRIREGRIPPVVEKKANAK